MASLTCAPLSVSGELERAQVLNEEEEEQQPQSPCTSQPGQDKMNRSPSRASSTFHKHRESSGPKAIRVTTGRLEPTTGNKGSLQTPDQPLANGTLIASPAKVPHYSIPSGRQLDLAAPDEPAAEDIQQPRVGNHEQLRFSSFSSASASTKCKAATPEPVKSIAGVQKAFVQRDSVSFPNSLSSEKSDVPKRVALGPKDTGTYHLPEYSCKITTLQSPCRKEGVENVMRSGAQETYTTSGFHGLFPAFSVTAANEEKVESGEPGQDVTGYSEKISGRPHNCHPQQQQAPCEGLLDRGAVRENEILVDIRRLSFQNSGGQAALRRQITADGLGTEQGTENSTPTSNPSSIQKVGMSENDFSMPSKSRVPRSLLQQPSLTAEQTSSTTAMISEELSQRAIDHAAVCMTSSKGKFPKEANADKRLSSKTPHIASAEKHMPDPVIICVSKRDFSCPNTRKAKLVSEGLSRESVGREITMPTVHGILDEKPPEGENYVPYSAPLSESQKIPPKIDCARGDLAVPNKKVDIAERSSAQLSASTCSTSNVTINDASGTTPRQADVAIVDAGAPVHHEVEQLVPKEHFLYPVALLLVFVLILVLCFLFLPAKPSAVLSIGGRRPASRLSTGNCTSIRCLRSAPYLGNLLSWRRVDPCHNFNAFVCLRWTAQFLLPSANGSSADGDYASYLEHEITKALQKKNQNSVHTRPLHVLYEKCKDFEGSDNGGYSLLSELLWEVSPGGFPLTTPPPAGISVWKTAARILRKSGAVALVSVGVASHPVFTAKDIASVGPPQLLTTGSDISATEALRLYMTAFLMTVDQLRDLRQLRPDFLAGVTFASELERLAQLRLKRSADKIKVIDSQSPLREFLTEAFGEFQRDLSSAANEILIRSPEFVGDIVDMVARTEVRTVLNYLGLRLMIQMAPFLPFSAPIEVYNALLCGKHCTRVQSQLCVRAVETALRPLVFSHIFASPSLNASTPALTYFARAFFDEFSSEIDASPFFDKSSKAIIGRILSKVRIQAIGPSWTQNANLVRGYVEGLPEITANDSAHHVYFKYHQHSFIYTQERGARMRWSGSAFSDDCWHESHPRTVYVPLLAFNGTQALEGGGVDAMQLSRLGPRLGRCLFDMLLDAADSGEDDERWLTVGTRQKLLEAEACSNQRQDYIRFGRLRDILALRASYGLFAKMVDVDGELAVRNHQRGSFTAAQAFYASLMLQKCEKGERPPRVEESADAALWRVALQNSFVFSETYKCRVHSVMNPPYKCGF